MNRIYYLLLLTIIAASCRRSEIVEPIHHPGMKYTDLKNAEMKVGKSQRADIDGDGVDDFAFGTLLVGDPVFQRDRLQFYAYSFIKKNLLVDGEEQTPVKSRNEKISSFQDGYNWFEIAAIVLAEKITPLQGMVNWQGAWKHADHKFLPVQLDKNGQLYNGWIEVSFDMADEKLILHRSGISMEADQTVLASY